MSLGSRIKGNNMERAEGYQLEMDGRRKQVHEMSTSLVVCACVKGAGTARAVQGPGQPAGGAGSPCRSRLRSH